MKRIKIKNEKTNIINENGRPSLKYFLDIMNFTKLISNIEKRPRAYLLNESIRDLYNLLLGFSLSDHEKDTEEIFFFDSFSSYVNTKVFGFRETNYSWEQVLMLLSGGNEQIALKNFFNLYHELKMLKKDKEQG